MGALGPLRVLTPRRGNSSRADMPTSPEDDGPSV